MHDRAAAIRSYALDDARDAQNRFRATSLNLELASAQGQYGLHAAEGPSEVAAWLSNGAPINGLQLIDYGDGKQHWETPLLTAYVDGHYSAARALIQHGADVEAPNAVIQSNGAGFAHTVLHMLASRGDHAGVADLLDAGAHVNRQTTEGSTALHFAAQNDDLQTLQMLLDAGADQTLPDFEGRTPLDWAGSHARSLLLSQLTQRASAARDGTHSDPHPRGADVTEPPTQLKNRTASEESREGKSAAEIAAITKNGAVPSAGKKFWNALATLTALAFTANILLVASQLYGLWKGGPFEWFGSGATTLLVLVLAATGLAMLTTHLQRRAGTLPKRSG